MTISRYSGTSHKFFASFSDFEHSHVVIVMRRSNHRQVVDFSSSKGGRYFVNEDFPKVIVRNPSSNDGNDDSHDVANDKESVEDESSGEDNGDVKAASEETVPSSRGKKMYVELAKRVYDMPLEE